MTTDNLCGILPVTKPEGWTSFDVIAKLRRVLKIRRLGHSGTLDPMATGVLPVFVGRATKACDIIPDRKKVYTAGFELGITTDTLDITGTVLKKSGRAVTLGQIEEVKVGFIGDIMQTPPMYSAVKVDGKRLYELARQGKEVERKPRPVHIDAIEILSYDEDVGRGVMRVSCEKGTYIRSVISDIGDRLGCGGVMTSLERTYSGGIDISQCRSISQIEEICADGDLEGLLIPIDRVFEVYDKVCLGEWETRLYRNGVKLRTEQTGLEEPEEETSYRVYGCDGSFLGIGKIQGGEFRCVKNF